MQAKNDRSQEQIELEKLSPEQQEQIEFEELSPEQQEQLELEELSRKQQEQIEFEELSRKQQEQLFKEYASQQQKEELEQLSQKQREEFERHVSDREREQLEEYRLKKLKQEYEKERGEPIESFFSRINSKSNPQSPSLTQDYLKFKQTSQQKQEREHKQYSQDNPNYSSLDNFKVWFYLKRADDEFQIRHGIYPPQDSTPAGIVYQARLIADIKLARVIKEEKERLKLDGLSAKQIEEQRDKILQEAHKKLDKEWKETIAKNLKAWQEQKGIKSVESFVSSNEENPSQVKEVKVSDLEAWRQEAQELNRSERHLDKIDRVIESSTERVNKNHPNATVKIDERDFKAMQRDRSEFKQQKQELEQRQEQSQNQSVARGRGR